MTRLQGKVAVVTGASKGIGAGVAKTLAAAGAAVVVNYASSKEGADRVVAAIEQQGGKAIAVQSDVSKAADVERLFAETKKAFGALDILVNNAGVFQVAPLEAVTEEEFHRQFNTNVLGTLLATREAARHFGPEGGSVINVTSVASVGAMPNSVVYSSTKGAVDSITRVLAAELAPRKIRVNAVAPGMTATEGAEVLMRDVSPEQQQSMLATIPMGRIGQPEDIAQTVLFLASDESSWLTGERITSSGGQR
jgi:3-oxoacyl-[acyl-carrier protein] reductase